MSGCGCNNRNKNKSNKKIKKQNRSIKLSSIKKKQQQKDTLILMGRKLKFCKSCSNSKQTKNERRNKTRICHKNSIAIQSIINNKTIRCPIGNF